MQVMGFKLRLRWTIWLVLLSPSLAFSQPPGEPLHTTPLPLPQANSLVLLSTSPPFSQSPGGPPQISPLPLPQPDPLVLLSTSPPLSQSPGEPPQTIPLSLPQANPNESVATGKDSVPKAFLKDVWGDQKAIWTTPFRMDRRQWLTIALPLAAGTAALIATDEDAAKWLPNSDDQVTWSKRVSYIGAIYTLGGIVTGTILAGKKTGDPEMVNLGRSSARALADSYIVNTALKYMTARERPLENDGQGRFWKGGNSFPSGHAMNSWAVAMVVARHPRSPTWLKITSCTVATAVSLSRWGARKHFPSDILVGGVFGGLIGNYVVTHQRP